MDRKYNIKPLNKYIPVLYPVVLVTISSFALYYFPIHFIPDLLHLKNYSKIYELFSLIINSLSTLIGIYVSVSLVAYAVFKEKSGIDFHKSISLNSTNSIYISFCISTIVCAIICSIIISPTNPSTGEITIVYYNLLLFITALILLFPVAFKLFSSLDPVKIATQEISRINANNILIRAKNQRDPDEMQNLFESDHLLKTQNIILALISGSETVKVQTVIIKSTEKITRLITETEDQGEKNYIVTRLISFYINIIDFALLQPNNYTLLRNIWLSVGNMYTMIAIKKESTLHLEKFRKEFFDRIFNRLFESNKEELINEGVTTVRHIIEEQIRFNMPSDEKILFLDGYRTKHDINFTERNDYMDEDIAMDAHWREAAYEFMGVFSSIMKKAIKYNKPEIINVCSEQINKMTFNLRLKKTGIYKQSFFYIMGANIICDYAYMAFEKKVFTEGSDVRHLTPTLFEILIQEKHPAARTVLQKYCHWLMAIQKINGLDYWLLGGLNINDFIITEGELGGIAKTCAIHFKNGKEVQDCLDDCIFTFEKIKLYYESHLPTDQRLYFQIKNQLKNILKWLKDKNVEDEVIDKVTLLINSFKERI